MFQDFVCFICIYQEEKLKFRDGKNRSGIHYRLLLSTINCTKGFNTSSNLNLSLQYPYEVTVRVNFLKHPI